MRKDSTPNLISIVSFLVMGFADCVPSFYFYASFHYLSKKVPRGMVPVGGVISFVVIRACFTFND